MQNIDTILTAFVNEIREQFVIVSSAWTTGAHVAVEYTMKKNMAFVANDIVNINGSQYFPVDSFNNTSKKFVVSSTVKIDSGYVQKNPVFYFYGKENEITTKIARYQKDSILRYKIFPFIWRVPSPFLTEVNETVESEYSLDLIIGTRCEANKDTDYTTTNIIAPVLRPIYENFIKAIKANKRFELNRQTGETLQHEISEEILSNNEQNITAQFLAAMVIRNLKLKTNIIKNCI